MLDVIGLECARGERTLFRDLNFSLPAGTLFELRGENGSGKTTLLRAICGLLSPVAGEIRWNDQNIKALGDDYRAHLGYLGHLNGLKDELSALENLALAAPLAGIDAAPAAIENMLRQFGLARCLHLPCKALSQGQKRRAALARIALGTHHGLWLLDEPFAALDTAAIAFLQSLIERHLANGGIVMLTTHQDVPITAPHRQRLELGA
ncbi:MAG TPA: cytochrome c biogenesis heme-transporting ATPase CcmA [Burkholderiales bacterium]|nr:cytochrome c biogenesis heme-transporting ATPase CcmA [Burkholderiales bacterium]